MDLALETVVDLFRTVYRSLDEEVSDLDAEALSWTPAPDTNSIAVLVVHTIGSAEEVLRIVRNLPNERDRDAEFVPNDSSAAALRNRIAAAIGYLDEVGRGITVDDLAAMRPRPNRDPQTGMYWLLHDYGHAREHLAHIQLTKQIYAGVQQP